MSRQPHPSGVSDGNYPSLPQELVDELEHLVHGEVSARIDKEFQSRTTIFNGNVVTPAKAVVIPTSVEDVSNILKFCTNHGLYPSIKAGGYGTAGWAINGDIVIDLSRLNGIHIEPPSPGDRFTSLRNVPLKLEGGGVDKGKAKERSDEAAEGLSGSGTRFSPGSELSLSVNSGKRRRSVELERPYNSPEESGGLPRDPFVAKFLQAGLTGDLPLPSPAIRRRLTHDGESASAFTSDAYGAPSPTVYLKPENGGGDVIGSSGMEHHSSGESEKSGRTSVSASSSTSTTRSMSTSNSTSTAFTTPSTAPTSPRPKSSDSNKPEVGGEALDVITSISAGLHNQPSIASRLQQLPDFRAQQLLPEEMPVQPPYSRLSPSEMETLTPRAEPPPPSRTPSFSVRSEDPFGYMSAAPSVPAPVLSGVGAGIRPSRGFEQTTFESGSSSSLPNDTRSGPETNMLEGQGRTRTQLFDGTSATTFLSDATTPVHPHAYVIFGAGEKQKDIDIFTARHPLPATSPNGNVSSVAYHIPLAAHPVGSSVMLLGGFGFLSRLHGLSIDALVEVEMVLADGSIVYVNKEEHLDLWWAIRGAGPAFGVVTRYKAKAYPVPVVFAGNLIYNFHASTAASLIKHFRDCVKSAPRELYANVLLTAGPADKGSLVVVQLCYIGNKERGRKFLEAIASWDGEPCLLNEVSEKSFLGQQDSVAQILRGKAGRQWYIRSALITSLPDEIIHKTVNEFADTPVGCTWLFELAGGAVGDASDTCLPKEQREAGFTIAAFHQWELDDDDPLCVTTAEHWIEKTLTPVSTGGPYPAFLGRHEKAPRIIGCFGPNWDRLCEMKKKYDPKGLFRHNFWPLDEEGKVCEPCEREPKSPVMCPREV